MSEAEVERLRGEVLARLDEIQDPCSVVNGTPMGLVEMGLVDSVEISGDGDVEVCMRLTSPFCEMIGFMKTSAIDKIAALDAVGSVTVRCDSGFDWSPDRMTPAARERREQRLVTLRSLKPV